MSATTVPQTFSISAPINGFTEELLISDFPARARKLTLHIRRRRWLDEEGKNVILDVYTLANNGTKFSDEFAEFLKKNLDQTPVTAKSLGRSYMIDGSTLEHAYTNIPGATSRSGTSARTPKGGCFWRRTSAHI